MTETPLDPRPIDLWVDFEHLPGESSSMALVARARHRYSYAEYLDYERDSGLKHEFDDGEIFAMAGGSRRHNALASRVSASLELHRPGGGVAFQSDQKVRVLATGRAAYPDASMVCGPIEGDPSDPTGATITNPTLLVEVLSPSTESDDRGSKWQHYQLVPSLREYVLVSQTEPRIEVYRRLPSGTGGWPRGGCGPPPDVVRFLLCGIDPHAVANRCFP